MLNPSVIQSPKEVQFQRPQAHCPAGTRPVKYAVYTRPTSVSGEASANEYTKKEVLTPVRALTQFDPLVKQTMPNEWTPDGGTDISDEKWILLGWCLTPFDFVVSQHSCAASVGGLRPPR